MQEINLLQYMSEPRTSSDQIQPQRLGRSYALYWAGSLSVAIGLWVQRLTVAWLAWEMTGSGFWLGLIATADLLPSVALGPVAGIFADRLDRKRLTLLCQSSNVALVLVLAIFISDGHIDRYWLLAFAVLNGLISGVQQPVRMSLTATLVSKPQIARAVTLMSINAHAGRFAGPIIVGPILAFGETSHAFLAAAGLYGAMIVLLPFIRVGDNSRDLTEWKGFRNEFSVGIRFATMNSAVSPVIWSFLLLSVFGRPIFELLPGLADGIFREGASGFSWLAGAVGAGTIAACLWLAHRPDARCTLGAVINHIFLFGASALALSVAPNFWTAVGLATVAAFTATAATIATVAVIQLSVPDDIRGRVLGIYGALYRAAPAVGAIAMGWISDITSLRWPIAIGAVVCIVWWLVMHFAKPRLAQAQEADAD